MSARREGVPGRCRQGPPPGPAGPSLMPACRRQALRAAARTEGAGVPTAPCPRALRRRCLLPGLALAGLVWAAPAPAAEPDGAFDGAQRLLATYFFWRGPWDDTPVTSGGRLGMSGTWKAVYPAPDDPGAAIFGLQDAGCWPGSVRPDTSRWPARYTDREQYVPWLMAEWRAMKWSGFDLVLVDDWHSLCFDAGLSPLPCTRDLAAAWLELDRRGEHPLPMAMFLETPFAWHPGKDGDATQASPDGIAELWEPVRAFLRLFYGEGASPPLLPVRALARVRVAGAARPLVQLWFPTWVGAGLRKWDPWTFRELRRLCRETFGVEPFLGVNQHVHGPQFLGGWSSIQPDGGREEITAEAGVVDYDVAWWGGMAGPQVYPRAIALGPGHWCPRQTGDKPVTPHYSTDYGEDQFRYVRCWRQVLSNPASFSRRILIVESWNNNDEGCAISYSEPKDFLREDGTLIDRWGPAPEFYMALTRELAPFWKEGRCPPRFAVGP